ncbi:GNAT family N-acetyltransferase [Corynebacterium pacaense]|uniref:GNAT family N-acetyltransferase n=1 Tax=Corynebacterium pacaense TaxID=1816684 RepID=UPI001FE7A36B|nr:GNAT family N-acetyltransferase [Corynebacterium pacaense]
MPTIRLAKMSDIPVIQRIERDTGVLFRGVGMDFVADDPPPPEKLLGEEISSGRVFVSVDGDESEPRGWLWLREADENLHIEQVSSDPRFRGQGIGTSLVRFGLRLARSSGYAGVTLTTYRDVPWNAPLYSALGFVELPRHAWGPELRAIREHEAEVGLDTAPRMAMIHPTTSGPPA